MLPLDTKDRQSAMVNTMLEQSTAGAGASRADSEETANIARVKRMTGSVEEEEEAIDDCLIVLSEKGREDEEVCVERR